MACWESVTDQLGKNAGQNVQIQEWHFSQQGRAVLEERGRTNVLMSYYYLVSGLQQQDR